MLQATSQTMRIAIDAMGGDLGCLEVLQGVKAAYDSGQVFTALLCGKEEVLRPALVDVGLDTNENIKIIPASEVVTMDDKFRSARKKKDSSIAVGLSLIKSNDADALVAIGNTSAAVGLSTLQLKLLPNIKRAGIACPMPNRNGGFTTVIDMGANIATKPEHLRNYGIMASYYVHLVHGIDKPTVGLLNVGEELGKGDATLTETYNLLNEANINFIGNVEGRDLFNGKVDIIVCDGFVGNALLKAAESLASSIMGILKEELMRSIRTKLGAWLAYPAFRILKKRMDHSQYGGAPLLGINGHVIIGHGSSNANSICNAIRVATQCASKNINKHIVSSMNETSDINLNNEKVEALL